MDRRTMIDMYLDLMAMGTIGFFPMEDVHPSNRNKRMPPLAVSVWSAYMGSLGGFIMRYHVMAARRRS